MDNSGLVSEWRGYPFFLEIQHNPPKSPDSCVADDVIVYEGKHVQRMTQQSPNISTAMELSYFIGRMND